MWEKSEERCRHPFALPRITAAVGHGSSSFIDLISTLSTQNSTCSRNNREKRAPPHSSRVGCVRGLGSHPGIAAIRLSHRKGKTEAVHLRRRAASKQSDTKSTRSVERSNKTRPLRLPDGGENPEPLTFETFQLFSQVLLISVFLVFQVFLREKTKQKKKQTYQFDLKPVNPSQDLPSAIKEESNPNSNYRKPIFLPKKKTSNSVFVEGHHTLAFSLSRTLDEGVGEKELQGSARNEMIMMQSATWEQTSTYMDAGKKKNQHVLCVSCQAPN